MMLLQPYVEKLAKKANIPPEIAMIVVSFVAHKLLSHHPTSGRDSSSFNLDDLLGQMSSGKIDSNVYQNSGMVHEISKSTGLDEATASKTLDARHLGQAGQQGFQRAQLADVLSVRRRVLADEEQLAHALPGEPAGFGEDVVQPGG